MKKELVGLGTYLYIFNLNEVNKYRQYRDKLSKTGTITESFINNKYAFEHQQRIIR